MNRGARHAHQRARRAALKADAAILLDRIAGLIDAHMIDGRSDKLRLEIAEMRLRLAPPPGVNVRIVRTGYSKGNSNGRA